MNWDAIGAVGEIAERWVLLQRFYFSEYKFVKIQNNYGCYIRCYSS